MHKVSVKYGIVFLLTYVLLVAGIIAAAIYLPEYLNKYTGERAWAGLIAAAVLVVLAICARTAGKKKAGYCVLAYVLGLLGGAALSASYFTYEAKNGNTVLTLDAVRDMWLPAVIVAGVVLLLCAFTFLKKAGKVINAILVVLSGLALVCDLLLWLSQDGVLLYPAMFAPLAAAFAYGICILSYMTDPVYPIQQVALAPTVTACIMAAPVVFLMLRHESVETFGGKVRDFINEKLPSVAKKLPAPKA